MGGQPKGKSMNSQYIDQFTNKEEDVDLIKINKLINKDQRIS